MDSVQRNSRERKNRSLLLREGKQIMLQYLGGERETAFSSFIFTLRHNDRQTQAYTHKITQLLITSTITTTVLNRQKEIQQMIQTKTIVGIIAIHAVAIRLSETFPTGCTTTTNGCANTYFNAAGSLGSYFGVPRFGPAVANYCPDGGSYSDCDAACAPANFGGFRVDVVAVAVDCHSCCGACCIPLQVQGD